MGADGYRVTRIVMMQWDPKKFLEMLRRNPQLSREEFEFLKSHAKLTSEIGMVGEPRRHRAQRQGNRGGCAAHGRLAEHRRSS